VSALLTASAWRRMIQRAETANSIVQSQHQLRNVPLISDNPIPNAARCGELIDIEDRGLSNSNDTCHYVWLEPKTGFKSVHNFCNLFGTRPTISWSQNVTARRLGQWNSPAASDNVHQPDARCAKVNSM